MSKAEVFQLLGSVEPFARSPSGDAETYMWGSTNRGQVTVNFRNAVVTSKSQIGL
jgi:hypothetical protein